MFFLLNHPPSPCKGICQLDAEVCTGCGRQIGEIVEWPGATAERKTRICDEATKRLAILATSSTLTNKSQP